MKEENKGDSIGLTAEEWDRIDEVWENIQKEQELKPEEKTLPTVKPSPFKDREKS